MYINLCFLSISREPVQKGGLELPGETSQGFVEFLGPGVPFGFGIYVYSAMELVSVNP
jgi:hypothetical protein